MTRFERKAEGKSIFTCHVFVANLSFSLQFTSKSLEDQTVVNEQVRT